MVLMSRMVVMSIVLLLMACAKQTADPVIVKTPELGTMAPHTDQVSIIFKFYDESGQVEKSSCDFMWSTDKRMIGRCNQLSPGIYQYKLEFRDKTTSEVLAQAGGSVDIGQDNEVTILPALVFNQPKLTAFIARINATVPGSGNTNTAPIADAGNNDSIKLGATITLDGSGSSDALVFTWILAQQPENSTATLSNANTKTPTIKPDVVGEYKIELVVSDGTVNSIKDIVTITVAPVDAANLAPSADAGQNKEVTSGESVTLNGSGSSDSDGNIKSYRWVSKESSITLSSTNNATTIFTAPTVSASKTYDFELAVTDNAGATDTDTVVITVVPRNEAPTAKAIADKTRVTVGTTITLDATGSTDPNQDNLTYTWSIISAPAGSTASLSSINNGAPTFVPNVVGSYTVDLTVTDQGLLSDNTNIILIANAVSTHAEPAMVKINGGSFQMGDETSPDGTTKGSGDSDEVPVHSVTVADFEMGKYEVTIAQFRVFVDATGHKTDAENNAGGSDGCLTYDGGTGFDWQVGKSWRDTNFSQTDNDPVVCVSWNDTKAYITWLSGETGLTYRLPSEAEWEYAARAGTTTTKYSFGDTETDLCQFANGADQKLKETFTDWPIAECLDGYTFTAPVGQFSVNAFGLYDMHGNVWEWVEDCWNSSYTEAPVEGSAWLSGDCERRVFRSGSWLYEPVGLRSADRSGNTRGYRSVTIGFRLARTL